MTQPATQATSWEEPVRDAEGRSVGNIKGQVCHDEAQLTACIGFSDTFGGFAPYGEQIAGGVTWPVAGLTDLEVHKDFRGQGLGTAALEGFLSYARAQGATMAFIRVGWWDYGCDHPDVARDRNIAWYSRRGFCALKPPSPKALIPYMYRLL